MGQCLRGKTNPGHAGFQKSGLASFECMNSITEVAFLFDYARFTRPSRKATSFEIIKSTWLAIPYSK